MYKVVWSWLWRRYMVKHINSIGVPLHIGDEDECNEYADVLNAVTEKSKEEGQ